jgi:hypothetical protein
MFTREWIEKELAGLIVQLHQTEGAISVLQQMLTSLEQAEQSAAPELTLAEFEALLPEGHKIEGIQVNEDNHHED